MGYTLYDLALYWFIYAFFGWALEAGYYAVRERGFFNRGLLSLPLSAAWGCTLTLMLVALPALQGRYVLQFLFSVSLAAVVEAVTRLMPRLLSPRVRWGAEDARFPLTDRRSLLALLAVGAVYYVTYMLIHPLLLIPMGLLPRLVKTISAWVGAGILAADFVISVYAVRTGGGAHMVRRQSKGLAALGAWISNLIWRRLRRAYPGIEHTGDQGEAPVFAKGLCGDKLLWIFFIASLGGDGTEMVYCRLMGGSWVSRSSLLYGPFSLVWGVGAVLLTVTLYRLAEKADRYVFLGGFFIGGAYEYMCSVFTELVFGTVFWDYSQMPLNIGGRTNVLFCFFWGAAALVWMKLVYPRLSRAIERVPVVAGKVVTWVVLVLMVCNATLTSLAMLRYQTRSHRPQSANQLEEFLDRQYGDAFMEHRWADMERVKD